MERMAEQSGMIPLVTRFVTGKDDAEPIVVEWYVVLPSTAPRID